MNKTQPASPLLRLDQAIYLAKAGRKADAVEALRNIVGQQPVNQAAWLWLSAISPERLEAEAALAKARQINPQHRAIARAEQWLAKRFSAAAATRQTPVQVQQQPQPQSKPRRESDPLLRMMYWSVVGLVAMTLIVGAAMLAVGVGIELFDNAQASATENSEAVVGSSDEIVEAQPVVAEPNEALNAEATSLVENAAQQSNDHYQQGRRQMLLGDIDAAQKQFELALEVDSSHGEARYALDGLELILEGKAHYEAGRWNEAIDALLAAQNEASDYPQIENLLYSAYYNYSLQLEAVGDIDAAIAALDRAIMLRPDLSEPRLHRAELQYATAAGTVPTVIEPIIPVEDRLILVGLVEQRMHVYEGDRLVYDFIVSTGEPGRETAVGEFEILNKIDVAYASTWNLDMPHWMGIYWAGPLQNGIHSLPTVRHTGQTLWDGYLGQRVSYGCIILGHDDSATLYEWSEVGTKVKIVPSIADWQAQQTGNQSS